MHVIHTPLTGYFPPQTLKQSSFYPGDPFYADNSTEIGNNGTDHDGDGSAFELYNEIAQGQPMNFQGFPTAWDVALSPSVANEPVEIAIIDAGWWDYTTNPRGDFDSALIDTDPLTGSGQIDGSGNFTPGLSAIKWDINDDGDDTTRDFPYRYTGEEVLGVLAADLGTFRPFGIDVDGSGTTDPDEIWNEGMAGINPGQDITAMRPAPLSTC